MSTPLTPAAIALAAHKFTLSVYQGYMLPNKDVETTLGKMLGADHIAWICEQTCPAAKAGTLARGMWDCNNLEMLAAYRELEHILVKVRESTAV